MHMARDGFDIRALARAINRRREEYNRRNPARPLPITPALSRILEHDEDYIPYRSRSKTHQRRPHTNPRISTIVDIAAALNTTVGDLLGEPAFRVSRDDRRRMREFVRWMTEVFELDAADLDDPQPKPRRTAP